MKKIVRIMKRDFSSGMRDYMIIYILLMPFLMALILNGVTTSVSESILSLVVDDTVTKEEENYLAQFGQVTRVRNEEALRQRVEDLDDVYGILKEEGRFVMYRQGNEKLPLHETVLLLLEGYDNEALTLPVEVSVSDVGWQLSPIKQYGGGLLTVFVSVFGGMIILINLVEEKQENTLAAMNVAPVKRMEYLVGKALLGFLVPLVHVLGMLLILNYGGIHYGMAAVVTLSIALISVIIGFAIGVNSDNVLAAISGMKMVFLPIFASIFGAIYLRESLQWLLYWSPFYWAFKSMNSIILKEALWGDILLHTGIILFLGMGVLLLMRKKIQRGLK